MGRHPSLSPLWHSSCAYSLLWNCHFHMNGHRHCAQPSTSDSLYRDEWSCVILPGAARRRCSLWISFFLCPLVSQLLNPNVMLMLKGKKIVVTQDMLMKPKAYNSWLCRHLEPSFVIISLRSFINPFLLLLTLFFSPSDMYYTQLQDGFSSLWFL